MILCFSGNGNSRRVADLLSSQLGDEVKMLCAPDVLKPEEVRYEGAERIIWVLPVHCWGVPVVVKRFINGLSDNAFDVSAVHYMVLTCGDETGNAHLQWRGLMKKHGWATAAVFSVQMPNTYTLLPGFSVDAPELAEAKLSAAPVRVAAIANAITEGSTKDDLVIGPMATLKTSMVYPLFERYDINPSKFHASEACISCGKCVRACPLDNIELVDGRPAWGRECTECLGCYNVCPQRAIDYGRRSKGKGQFYLDK